MNDAPTQNPEPAEQESAPADAGPPSSPSAAVPETSAPGPTAAEVASDDAAAESAPPAKKTAAKKTAAKKTTKKTAKKTAAEKPAKKAAKAAPADEKPADEKPAKKTAKAKAAAAPAEAAVLFQVPETSADAAPDAGAEKPPAKKTAKKAPAKKTTKKAPAKAAPAEEAAAAPAEGDAGEQPDAPAQPKTAAKARTKAAKDDDRAGERATEDDATDAVPADDEASDDNDNDNDNDGEGGGNARRRRRRGGRRRRKPAGEGNDGTDTSDAAGDADKADNDDKPEKGEGSDDADDTQSEGGSSSSRRRRRRRRSGEGGGDSGDDPENTVTKVRKPRSPEDEITAVSGSTRLEAKKQRRREGREAGRRRAPIVSEAEFLARRESVERVMAIRQRKDLTQIAVLEDKVLVEHYVARESQTSLIGNVYLGRVQNVLPSMEAAFIDIGKGRNAVLYAGEVNWQALGHKDGQPRKIESVLQSGQTVLVQVTKDPIGHKGARLTSQVSLAGRFLVYVPDGTTSGISRKLPDTERARLKALLKEIVPESAGVIVRTAAEGASEEELTRDVERLKARWTDIEAKVAKGNAPQLLYGEPDLTLKVVRDLFTEDFAKLVVQGDDAWQTVSEYVAQVAPDLAERLEHHEAGEGRPDLFSTYRIDEQIAKGTDRKVWLPSGGSLIIDRTEAMTVVDVNTGKFTGSGGNLEETVTKNNLEAAEEIVRQLRLRDIGGIIVVDFIDMVLESNRDLVLRRLVECLGRDRTRHQVAEVTSLGLVQMTRKRIGTGLLEAFSETCAHCQGRGVIVHELPVEPKRGGGDGDDSRRGRRRKGGGNGGRSETAESTPKPVPSPKDIAAMAKPADEAPKDEAPKDEAPAEESTKDEPVAAPAQDESAESAASTAPAPAAVETPDEQPVEPETSAAGPGTTTVVTRTRRRAASRPAGPPVAPAEEASVATAEADAADTEAPEIGTDDGATETHVEHVPIKKKGARKR